MKVLKSLAVSAIMMCAGSGVSAQVIDDDTKCATLEALTQAHSPSDWKVKEATGYIEVTMRALDRLHGQRGKPQIFPQMTEYGRSSLVQTVVSRCHNRQTVTIADTAIETYEEVRASEPLSTLDKTAKKPVRTRQSRAAPGRHVRDEL